MKKIIKYTLIVITTFFILIAFFIGGADDDSDNKEEMANTALDQIASYYNKNAYYPQNLKVLRIYNNQEFVTYVQNNTFKYSVYGENEVNYVFSWRAGAMDWTGYSCTNDKSKSSKKMEGLIRTYSMNDGSVCTVTDLH